MAAAPGQSSGLGESLRKPLIAGNWKMNLNHLEAIALVQKVSFSLKPQHFDSVEVVVLPSFTNLRSVQTMVDGDKLRIGYGAQDLSHRASGAYTGDIAGSMLAKLGCSYVVIGHSERREYHAESDELINAKVKAAFSNSLVPILCVGERLDVREAGSHVEHCLDQLTADLDGVSEDDAATLVIAYEPVWAIGTGKVATPADAQEVCSAIRLRLTEMYSPELAGAVRLLYGGSVKSNNATEIVTQRDVDGALVGGASLDGAEFAGICIAAGDNSSAK
jgi:triosephosphate isomerase